MRTALFTVTAVLVSLSAMSAGALPSSVPSVSWPSQDGKLQEVCPLTGCGDVTATQSSGL